MSIVFLPAMKIGEPEIRLSYIGVSNAYEI